MQKKVYWGLDRNGVIVMTDSEKLDLLLIKMNTVEKDVDILRKDVDNLKRQFVKSTTELKVMDKMILDEVERVHIILDMHKEDKSVHTA